MKLLAFLIFGGVLAACSEETDRPTCDALAELCHDAAGEAAHACHEAVEDPATTEEECADLEAECDEACR